MLSAAHWYDPRYSPHHTAVYSPLLVSSWLAVPSCLSPAVMSPPSFLLLEGVFLFPTKFDLRTGMTSNVLAKKLGS